ncbi:MAG: hypothetical protein HQ500_07235 [Flavobacteriales bacterium]|nr:hypothetical protein [Flavobacteriales bacterium]
MFYGALFIASAILKLFPLDYFELILVHQAGVSWAFVPIASRILLVTEFGLGVFILSGYQLRFSLWFSLGLLSAFQVFLFMQILQGEGDADCGCFGELIPLDGPSSLIKNFGFMLLGGMLLIRSSWAEEWSLRVAGPLLAVLAIPVLLLIEPMPAFSRNADFEVDLEMLSRESFGAESPMTEGNKTVVVMLSNCIHCAQLSSFIATLAPKDVADDLRIIIVGEDAGVDFFVEETGIKDFHYVQTKDRELIGAIDGTFPTVLYLEAGEVTKKWKGRDVNIRLLNELLALD